MYSVYVLKSESSGNYYVGMSQDVETRLLQHNSGKSKFTSGHIPWLLVFSEEIGDSVAARKREKYLKSAAGKRYLRKVGIIS